MKKYKTHWLVFFALLFVVSGFRYEAKGQVSGNWSGTVTYHQRVDTKSGGWTEKQINVTITDNVAKGTVDMRSENIMNGKLLCKTSCSGSGKAELNYVDVSVEASEYSIEVTGPKFTCTNTGILWCDPPTEDLEGIGISISEKKLGSNPNILSGTQTESGDVLGLGTVTNTTTWSLDRLTDVELIVTPEDYDIWLPEPGTHELNKGNVMNIALKVYGKNGLAPTIKAKSFELRLSKTSREPGITLNMPLVPSARQLPDLRFLPIANGESMDEDQFIIIPCKDGINGKASIGSYDGGGWTILTAEAVLEDDSHIKGSLMISGGNQEIPIPKMAIGSKIGNAWLALYNNPGEMDDLETSKGNTNDGDGLTAYEEYRGVIAIAKVQGAFKEKFQRLDPQKKELGVMTKRTDYTLFSEGISWFENATGLKVIPFDETEIGMAGRLNKNASSAHDYDQYVLKINNAVIAKGVLGIGGGGPGVPKIVKTVTINIKGILASYQGRLAKSNLLNVPMPFTGNEFVALVLAHELAHGRLF